MPGARAYFLSVMALVVFGMAGLGGCRSAFNDTAPKETAPEEAAPSWFLGRWRFDQNYNLDEAGELSRKYADKYGAKLPQEAIRKMSAFGMGAVALKNSRMEVTSDEFRTYVRGKAEIKRYKVLKASADRAVVRFDDGKDWEIIYKDGRMGLSLPHLPGSYFYYRRVQ